MPLLRTPARSTHWLLVVSPRDYREAISYPSGGGAGNGLQSFFVLLLESRRPQHHPPLQTVIRTQLAARRATSESRRRRRLRGKRFQSSEAVRGSGHARRRFAPSSSPRSWISTLWRRSCGDPSRARSSTPISAKRSRRPRPSSLPPANRIAGYRWRSSRTGSTPSARSRASRSPLHNCVLDRAVAHLCRSLPEDGKPLRRARRSVRRPGAQGRGHRRIREGARNRSGARSDAQGARGAADFGAIGERIPGEASPGAQNSGFRWPVEKTRIVGGHRTV
jgi:hypothetical protein